MAHFFRKYQFFLFLLIIVFLLFNDLNGVESAKKKKKIISHNQSSTIQPLDLSEIPKHKSSPPSSSSSRNSASYSTLTEIEHSRGRSTSRTLSRNSRRQHGFDLWHDYQSYSPEPRNHAQGLSTQFEQRYLSVQNSVNPLNHAFPHCVKLARNIKLGLSKFASRNSHYIEPVTIISLCVGTGYYAWQNNFELEKIKHLNFDWLINKNTLVLSLGGAFMPIINDLLYKLRSYLDQNDNGFGTIRILHQVLQQESKDKVEHFPIEYKKAVEKMDDMIASLLSGGDSGSSLFYLSNRENYLIMLPYQCKNIAHFGNHHLDIKKQAHLLRRTENLLKDYPDIKESLDSLITQMRQNSVSDVGTKPGVYLWGPPGTGKTRFVRELGRRLGLYVCTPRMPFSSDGFYSLEDYLFGRVSFNPRRRNEENSDSDRFGIIVDCLIQAGHLNPIIFFDEADVFLHNHNSDSYVSSMPNEKPQLGVLKKLLNVGDDKSYSDSTHFIPELSVKIDISRVTYIFAGNLPLKNKALRSRMHIFEFRKLEFEQRKNAAQQAKQVIFKELKSFGHDRERLEIIKHAIDENLDTIVRIDQSKNSGARILKSVIREFASKIDSIIQKQIDLEQHYYNMKTGGPKVNYSKLNLPTDAEYENIIQGLFQHHGSDMHEHEEYHDHTSSTNHSDEDK